jgi:hypothetical protein
MNEFLGLRLWRDEENEMAQCVFSSHAGASLHRRYHGKASRAVHASSIIPAATFATSSQCIMPVLLTFNYSYVRTESVHVRLSDAGCTAHPSASSFISALPACRKQHRESSPPTTSTLDRTFSHMPNNVCIIEKQSTARTLRAEQPWSNPLDENREGPFLSSSYRSLLAWGAT